MDKLKPCPFCGSEEIQIGRGTEDREGYPTYMYCVSCGSQGPWIYTREKACFVCSLVAAEMTGWNTRKEEVKDELS